MRILTVGDSFTYGDELADIQQAWPYVLQNKLSCELTNLGKPSTGNTSMVRNVVEHASNYDLIIVAWSHYARMEFADRFGIYDTWPGHRGVMFTGNVGYRMELLNYINHHHSDKYLYRQYLINILLIQHFIQHHNKKYLMLDSFGNNFDDFRLDTQIAHLIKQVDKRYYIGWLKDNMTDWTYTTSKGPHGHFLEEGHAKVAEKIYEYIRHLGWIS